MSTLVPTYLNVNQNGIPTISSNSVVVTTTAVQYDFTNYRVVGGSWRGLILFRLAQPIPTGTTTTLPVVFTSDGATPSLLPVMMEKPSQPQTSQEQESI